MTSRMNIVNILLIIGVSIAAELPCSLSRTNWQGHTFEEPINECFVSGSYSTVYTCIDTNTVQVKQTTGSTCDGSLNSYYQASDGYSDSDNSFSIRCTVDCIYTTPAPTAPTALPTGPPSIHVDIGNPNDCLKAGHSLIAWYDGSSVNISSNTWIDKTVNHNDGYISTNTQGANELFNGYDSSSELYLNGYPVLNGNTWGYVILGSDSNNFMTPQHTVFNVCKYKNEGSKGRILQSYEYHAAYGFFNGLSGVAFESNWWDYITINGAITQTEQSQFDNNWLISSQRHDLYRGNGRDFTINSAVDIVTENSRLSINTGKDIPNTNDQDDSDWACAEVIVSNDLLELDEITCVEQYLSTKYDITLEDQCQNVLESNTYGSGAYSSKQTTDDYTLYQGKVLGMTHWGIRKENPNFYPSIYFQWKSTLINESLAYGTNDYFVSDCVPFNLENDDYINGFRVKYRSKVNGLAFYSAKGNTYECFSDVTISNSEKDTGTIVMEGYYLSGFEIHTPEPYYKSTDAIYGIKFQFTSVIDSCNMQERYILAPSKQSWSDAQRYCQSQFNTNLATVRADELLKVDQIRNKYLTNYKSEPIWIGLTDIASEANWSWIDGTTCDSTDGLCINNWGVGEPNNWESNEHCAELIENVVNDINCDETRLFLCNAITLSPTSSPITSAPTQQTLSPTLGPTEQPTSVTNIPSESPTPQPSDNLNSAFQNRIISFIWISTTILFVLK